MKRIDKLKRMDKSGKLCILHLSRNTYYVSSRTMKIFKATEFDVYRNNLYIYDEAIKAIQQYNNNNTTMEV